MNSYKVIDLLFAEADPKVYNAVNFILAAILFVCGIGLGLSWHFSLVIIIAGFFFWLFLEYVIHRYVFHHKSKNATIRKIVFAIHGIHHARPKNEVHFDIPIFPTVIGWLIIITISYLIIGIYALPLITGTILMHIYYNYIHHVLHREKISNKYLRMLKESHMKHHFKDPNSNFGVTNVFFDKLFQTFK